MSRRNLHGEQVRLVEYSGKDCLTEFAQDILAREYRECIIHGVYPGLDSNEVPFLVVVVGE